MSSRLLARTILIGIITAVISTGCHHGNGVVASHQPTGPGSETSVQGIGGPGESGVGARPLVGGEGLPEHGQFPAVLFDYDSARIRPSEESKLEAVAAYLKANPGKLIIEGHCDERGTAEYNRALGERRAIAARDELVKLGADTSRMSTISYGKDRPVDPGHDEAAWAKNRRCEFVVVGQ
ncbi:MAG TPA: OmpA family protein [Verrucomicrobiae bacterium]|nr:OmpA family protein [Verrucomicrobiae bacterium]